MKFRKKPVVIEATQWLQHGDHPHVRRYLGPETFGRTACSECGHLFRDHHGWIDTLEGGHRVCPMDWIITGVRGEQYPCKPDIFEATYEPVEE